MISLSMNSRGKSLSNQQISKITLLESPKSISDKEFIHCLAKWSKYTKLDTTINMKGLDEKFKHVYDVPTLVGIEVEVEGVKSGIPLPDFWRGKEDGSLRGASAEFFSIPLTPRQAFYATSLLYSAMKKLSNRGPDFSWRTSIQDHLNLLDLKEENLKVLLILSIIMERFMFEFVGGKRNQSVFCVPLTESLSINHLAAYIQGRMTLPVLVAEWQKYSSVNLKRLFPLDGVPGIGTIEFRHLGGTKNLPLVLGWHSLLLQLFRASTKVSLDQLYEIVIGGLPSSKAYADFVASVFSPEIVSQFKEEDLPILMSSPISKTKELFIKTPKSEGVKLRSSLAAYATYVHKKSKKKTSEMKKKTLGPHPEDFDGFAVYTTIATTTTTH